MDQADEADDLLDLRRIEPRHGLVEEQHVGPGREAPRDLETLAIGEGEASGRRVPAWAQAHDVHDLRRRSSRGRRVRPAVERPDQDILDYGEAGEGLDDLEGPRESEP